MQIILPGNDAVLKILKRFKNTTACECLSCYCVQVPVKEGVLLHHRLTREMLLLTAEEHGRVTELDYLRERWFVVPRETNEKELADFVRWVLVTRQPKQKHITNYTIFTTMDCNARCFYCFEKGSSRTAMSRDTAMKTVEYIRTHCGGENVKLAWFGGEPLYNIEIIDTICRELRKSGIEFHSTMISNGYLFNDEAVQKARLGWNLKRVQITLDGTEEVYNRVKAYVYREGNPYQVVMENISRLLDASVPVVIRLNVDLYNADNLMKLVDELANRFSSRKGFYVYAYHLFKKNMPMAQIHTDDEWEKRDAAINRLMKQVESYGMASKRGLQASLRLNFCKADHGGAVTILPTGHIGLCDGYSESEFIGHIDREELDEQQISSWKETMPEIPECAGCFYYPDCIRLRKCVNNSLCFPQLRREKLRTIQREMCNEYERWKLQQNQDETEEDELC